ncbi:hypothetical protein [Aliarcobacter butzleri]|uniref:hypothetical protein n=1 Tax=Aliarcobacter butzleri TaxID=28197 RepID=UPI00102DBE7E|nr:hypothetical protein [Aliarcobacter butzleri]RZV18438.1 hypothetical protein D3M75_05485 [Aliarcobacter butzleri]
MKNLFLGIFLIFILTGCVQNGVVVPPNGGASISIIKPIWISGIYIEGNEYSKNLPLEQKNENLKVVNAGFWLANTNNKISQLVYAFDINIIKPFNQERVYTRAILENPINPSQPIIYEHYLNKGESSTKVTHATIDNVTMNKTYLLSFEIYSDKERKNLISKIDQKIVSVVDNTTGCVKLSDIFMNEKFSLYAVAGGVPIDKVIIACVKYK